MKKNYSELINTLCDFHTVALLDRQKTPDSKWIICFDRIAQMLYNTDYLGFLGEFPINKPVVMPGALEAHYNFLCAVIEYNQDLTSLKPHEEMFLCANDVKYVFDDFLYKNKYKLHRSKGPNLGFHWYNITPII